MVQIVENWALIRGLITSLKPHEKLPDYISATLKVLDVQPFESYKNMFSSALNQEVTVNIRKTKAEELSLSPGNEISLRVRKAGPTTAFADTDSVTKSA